MHTYRFATCLLRFLQKANSTVMHTLAGVMIPITVATHLDEQTTKRFLKLVFLILCETTIG